MESMSHDHEVLMLVFPLLGGKDLAACMLVSKQWQQIALDDYLWKCLCAKICPSVCKKQPPLPLTYHKLYKTISKPNYPRSHRLPRRLSFDDLEFYFDIKHEEDVVFSRVVQGSLLKKGKSYASARVHDVTQEYEMRFDVEQRFHLPISDNVRFSVIALRKDSNQVACLMNKFGFHCIGRGSSSAIVSNFIEVSPAIPITWSIGVSIVAYIDVGNTKATHDVVGIQLKLCARLTFKDDVMSLLEMIDWK